MSHLSKVFDYLPGPSSQQPHPMLPFSSNMLSQPVNTVPLPANISQSQSVNTLPHPPVNTLLHQPVHTLSHQPVNTLPHQPVNTLAQPVNTLPQPVNTLPQPVNTLPQPVNTLPHQPMNTLPQPANTLPQPVNTLPHPPVNTSPPQPENSFPEIQPCPPPEANTLPSFSENILPPCSVNTLPNPNTFLAGKLAENIRRSKRQKTAHTPRNTTSVASCAKSLKAAADTQSKAVPDSTSHSDEQQTDCPKEYLTENAYTDRLRFMNEVAKNVYKRDFSRLGSKDNFCKYLAAQQKWRWEINSIVCTLDTRVHNLIANKNAGIAQNVMRYATVPINCKSDDVRRCEKTVKELEKMVARIENTKSDVLMRKKLLFDDGEAQPSHGEVEFLDETVEKIDNLKDSVQACLTNVQDTLQNICRRFTTESVEAAEIRRQKRRKKENLKKKRKSQERQLEKKIIDILLRLTDKAVAERLVTSSGDATKIAAAEINTNELQQMNSETEMVALQAIVTREYLADDAVSLIQDKLAEGK